MLEELQQLLVGLGGAILGLLAVAWMIGKVGTEAKRPNRRSTLESQGTAERRLDQHDTLVEGDAVAAPTPVRGHPAAPDLPLTGPPAIAKIFIAPGPGRDMERVSQGRLIAGRGLENDRYALGRGFWSDRDECELTLIAQENLDEIEATTGIRVQDGQHRRNLVTRNIRLERLAGKRFRIGEAYLTFERPRPPCRYLQSITEPGMAKALVDRGGICAHCFKSGVIRENDKIVVIDVSPVRALAAYGRWLLKGKRITPRRGR